MKQIALSLASFQDNETPVKKKILTS